MAEKRNTRPKRSAKPGGKKTQPSIQGHRKNIYRKSRYYRQRQRRIHICLGILAVLLVSHRRHFSSLLFFFSKACFQYRYTGFTSFK